MPTIWTTCPKCLRPIETDYDRDDETVPCPGCDTEVAVPRPRLFKIPTIIWLGVGLMMVLPLAVAPGFANYYNRWAMYAPAGFLCIMMILPSYLLVSGLRTGWLMLMIITSLVLSAAITATMFGIVMFMFAQIGESFLYSGIPTGLVSAGLLSVLLLPSVRDWCKQ